MRYKYILDKDNLVYQKEKITLLSIVKKHNWIGVVGMFLGVCLWGISFFDVIESPKKYILDKKGTILVQKVSNVNSQFDSITNQLAHIQHKDDNLYRVISQMNPISQSVRQQGFGGINSYSDLEGYQSSDLLIESNKRSEIISKQLDNQIQSFENVFVSLKSLNDSLLAVPAICPVSPFDYHRISSSFGMRIHPLSGKLQKHDGLDFAARVGKTIYATGNGIVKLVQKSNKGYGNRVSIQHEFGYKTVYAHLDLIDVAKGDTVVRGQKIGTVGNTGTSTGPHLHYEVIYNRRKQNPRNYYVNDLSTVEFNTMVDRFTSN